MEGVILLIAIAALVLAWWWFNRISKARGWKPVARIPIGGLAGLVAFLLVASFLPASDDGGEAEASTVGLQQADEDAPPPASAGPTMPIELVSRDGFDGAWPFLVDEVRLQCLDSGALLVEDPEGDGLPTYSLTTPHLRYAAAWELRPLSELLLAGAAETAEFGRMVDRAQALCEMHRAPLGDEFLKISDLPDRWPFTIDAARLVCAEHSSLFLSSGRQHGPTQLYPLNGAARGRAELLGAAPLEEIWAANPELPGTRLSVDSAIRLALDRCEANG